MVLHTLLFRSELSSPHHMAHPLVPLPRTVPHYWVCSDSNRNVPWLPFSPPSDAITNLCFFLHASQMASWEAHCFTCDKSLLFCMGKSRSCCEPATMSGLSSFLYLAILMFVMPTLLMVSPCLRRRTTGWLSPFPIIPQKLGSDVPLP